MRRAVTERARCRHPAPPTPAHIGDWASQVTSIAIVRLDAAGRVRSWNPGAERIKGYTAREIIGSAFARFYRPQERERHLPAQLLERAARVGSAEDTGWRVRADGSLFWAREVITALRAEDSTLTGYVTLTRDLTAEKRAEDEREAFLRAFAHDHLSPVTALRGYIDLLEEAAPEHHALIERISTVSDHLVSMMSELTGHVSGTPAAECESVALGTLVREASALVLSDGEFHRLRIAGDRRLRVMTHAAMLRRAVANVIDNAAKYSSDDIGVTISEHDGEAEIAVTDTGRGIAPEDVASIFSPFQRGRLADADDGGSGLGLASVREIVERLGGRVDLTSALDAGTTVTLTLPLSL
ncbi:PAS domain-containing sensor histidine kinase [Microbacterium lushaniae]|nr:PAS domain-containing sensor histidine kinase [Microbacterium lushaniae]